MRRLRRELRWWGLYALIPLMVALIVLDDDAPLTKTWHMILLGAIAVVICMVALIWVEREQELVEREGADALVTYRPLPGTLEGMDTEPAYPEQRKEGSYTFVSEYDPLSRPPISHGRSREPAKELPR